MNNYTLKTYIIVFAFVIH